MEGRSNLLFTAVLQSEKLVRVSVLLVIIDQTGVRRRRDDAGRLERQASIASVAVNHLDRFRGPNGRERSNTANGVACVPLEELPRFFDRATRPLVLVTPIWLVHGLAREVEIEVRRSPSRSSGARENDPGGIPAGVVE